MSHFLVDRPIERSEDDKLGRLNFSSRLADAILQWKAVDSLVIALYGKWGSGKSSIINLAKSQLANNQSQKITIVEFNPWLFSGEEKLIDHFFNELANELELQNADNQDAALATKFRHYSNLLKIFPDKEQFSGIVKHILLVIGILGISLSNLLLQFDVDLGRLKVFCYVLGVILLIVSLISSVVEKIADFFESKSDISKRTVHAFKDEIKTALQARNNKLLVIIDDIDRLTPLEIRQIFKLVKINTDFPNIVFLLSFDRKIIEEALQLQEGVNGQEYIEKIIQVNFDIPVVSQEKIAAVFIAECNKVLVNLPESADVIFDKVYWGNVYNSGLKTIFKNVRDVKRFISSLGFNFSLLCQGKSIEVNPIDFIAIEAIRIFAPDFYHFLKTQKVLFTSTSAERVKRGKELIENALKILPDEIEDDIRSLISRLFPIVGQVLSSPENRMFATSSGPDAVKNLRVCSSTHFDAYFNFIPGGDESEISQFEIDDVLDEFSDKVSLVETLKRYDSNGKLLKLISRLEHFTSDSVAIPDTVIPNFIYAAFEMADTINDSDGFGPWSVHYIWSSIVSKLLYRMNNPENNVSIVTQAITNSGGIYGPGYYVYRIGKRDRNAEELERVIPEIQMDILRSATLNKIQEAARDGRLLSNKHFVTILFRWKEWTNSNDWQEYIEELVQSKETLIILLKHFVSTSITQSFSDLVSQKRQFFNFDSFQEICNVDHVKELVEAIPRSELADDNNVVQMFLKGKSDL